MNKLPLPFGLKLYEVIYLVLLWVTYKFFGLNLYAAGYLALVGLAYRYFGLKLYECAYLVLLGLAFYYSQSDFRGSLVPLVQFSPWVLFGITVAAGIGIVAGRSLEEWRALPNKAFFFVLLTPWVLLFAFLGNPTLGYIASPSLFAWLFDIFTSPNADAQYGLLIPFVVLILFWWKRQELIARPLNIWWPGLLIVIFALLTHLVGHAIQETEFSLIAFFLGIWGLMGLAWGRNWLKASFFPFFLLGFCIPLGSLIDSFTFRLRLIVSWIVALIAHAGLAPDLVRDGTQLFDSQRTFAYDVAAACSGIHSLVALLAMTIIWGFVSYKEPWRRGVLILAAIPLAIIGNVTRLCFTISVAELGGQAAGKTVETDAGFITFAVAIGCVFFIARWLERFDPQPKPPQPEPAIPGKVVPS